MAAVSDTLRCSVCGHDGPEATRLADGRLVLEGGVILRRPDDEVLMCVPCAVADVRAHLRSSDAFEPVTP